MPHDDLNGPPPAPTGITGIRVKLLLVDDQAVNLSALEAVLAPLGAETVTALSGAQALKRLLSEDGEFAAILLDVQMPGMDGFELARLIKERDRSRHTPILFLTAAGDDVAFQRRAYEAGAVDFLSKPFLPEILRAKVSVFVALYEQREELREAARLLKEGERERELLARLAQREAERAALASEKAALAEEVRKLLLRQRRFLREVLSSLSEGRLCLCDTAEELPTPLAPYSPETIPLSRESIRLLRRQVVSFGVAAGWPVERMQDLEIAVGEAAMNAVVHAGDRGAKGIVRGVPSEGTAQVWIEDEGDGIPEGALHRATMERGFSTAGTLGHGFWMMLRTADRVSLLTGGRGTTVVLEQDSARPEPAWLRGFPAAGPQPPHPS